MAESQKYTLPQALTLAGGITVLGNIIVPPVQLYTTHLLNEHLNHFSSEAQWLVLIGIFATSVMAQNILVGHTLMKKNCSSDPLANGLYFKSKDVLKVLFLSTAAAYLSSFVNISDLTVLGKSLLDGDGGKLIAQGLAAKSAIGLLYWGGFNALIMQNKADKVVERLQPAIDFMERRSNNLKNIFSLKGLYEMPTDLAISMIGLPSIHG